jgi:hypothetical protein
MLGAGKSPTPLVHTIILKDDHPFTPEPLGAGPLPHLAKVRRQNPLFELSALGAFSNEVDAGSR